MTAGDVWEQAIRIARSGGGQTSFVVRDDRDRMWASEEWFTDAGMDLAVVARVVAEHGGERGTQVGRDAPQIQPGRYAAGPSTVVQGFWVNELGWKID